jgi:hypothetical protein
MRPCGDQDYKKPKRKKSLNRDEVQGICAEEIIGLATREKNSAMRTALVHLEEAMKKASSSTIGTTQQQGAAKQSPRGLARDVRL